MCYFVKDFGDALNKDLKKALFGLQAGPLIQLAPQ
jgi:hypothetical protein